MMRALKKEGVQNYKVKMQQQGRENLWRAMEKRSEPEYTRQLQNMVRGALHLPTSPELQMMIKLQPILKPVPAATRRSTAAKSTRAASTVATRAQQVACTRSRPTSESRKMKSTTPRQGATVKRYVRCRAKTQDQPNMKSTIQK